MSVDLLKETRVTLNILARDEGVAVSTVWRWCLRGIRGHVLESFSVGGKKFTTREAFARFIARTNGEPVPSDSTRDSRQRESDKRAARKTLVKAGLID